MSDGLTPGDAKRYAERLGLDVDAEAAERIAASADGRDDLLADLDGLSPPSPPDRDYREPGDGEDEYGAFLAYCDVTRGEGGPLADMSVGVKDNIAVAGVPMTAGSKLLSGFVPPRDATVVERLLDAGATVAGKTNMPEFASGGDPDRYQFKLAHNHRDPARQPGDSSSGSAVAVATGEVDVALGSDTGGSVRFPAAYSGIVGVKPTRGLVSHHGFVQYAKTLDSVGVLARDALDAARTLGAIAGEDPRDERTWNARTDGYAKAVREGRDAADLTIGLPGSFFGHAPDLDDVVREALDRMADAGATLRRVGIDGIDLAIPAWLAISTVEMAAYLRARGENYWLLSEPAPALSGALDEGFRRRAGDLDRGIAEAVIYAEYLADRRGGRPYPRAGMARSAVADGVDAALDGVDVLASTTVPAVAPRWDEKRSSTVESVRNTAPFNLTGHPAVSVPCGSVEGLPVGLQFVGPRFGEAAALGAAARWEAVDEGE